MVLSHTPRGFAVYAEFRDSYGNDVRVQKSSNAEMDAILIFTNKAGENHARAASPHLTVEQAKLVRDALTEFINEYGSTEETQA